mmetsp:Transcript_22884/g.63660  ORF Transcript_22884/g.63660 Transcript_22884/m.63660 type:complete len:156 (+) Transcript_22884:709-1176(+)
MRGAGSNFGVATKLVYNLTPIPNGGGIYSGDIVKFPVGEGPPIYNSGKMRLELLLIMNYVNHFLSETTPSELSALLVLAAKGPVVARVVYIPKRQDNDKPEENLAKAKNCIVPIREFGKSLVDSVKMRSYFKSFAEDGQASYYYQKAGNCKRAIL